MVCDSGSSPSSLDDVERWLQCPFGQGSGLDSFRGAPTVLLVQAVSAGGGGSRSAMAWQWWLSFGVSRGRQGGVYMGERYGVIQSLIWSCHQ
jgi:hypothetical protein